MSSTQLARTPDGGDPILAAIMENTRAQLAYLDQDFSFVRANSAYVAASGYPWDALAGRNHFELFPDNENRAIFERVRDTGRPEFFHNKPFLHPGQPERGITYWDWSLTPVKDAGDRVIGLVLSLLDVTDHVRATQEQTAARAEVEQLRAEAEHRNGELTGLLEISRDVASSLDFEEILSHIIHHLRPVVKPRGTAIFIERDGEIAALVYHETDDGSRLGWIVAGREHAPLYELVVRSGETVIIDDLEGDDALAVQFRARAGGVIRSSLIGSRSWLGIPLIAKGRAVGMLRLDHSTPGYFTPRLVRLAQSIADQAAVAIDNARLYDAAQRAAAFEERQRLARELHDSISQSIYGIALGTHSARRLLADNPARVSQALDYVLSLAESAVAEMRALIFELRPESLKREGLQAALAHQIAAANARYRYEVVQELEDEGALSLEAQHAIYRIAQEALNNAGRHGKARLVSVRLQSLPEEVVLEIRDDGAGFDPDCVQPAHRGLSTMAERAAAIDAKLMVQSQPGQGAIILLRVPRSLDP